jgi:hypothetical protein
MPGKKTSNKTEPPSHIPQNTTPNPLPRIRSTAQKTFGEAFGAPTVAGYVGPGFHTWPGSADVLVGEYETGDSHPKKHVRRGVRRRHCSRGRWARFPHLALRPHPSKHGSESASPHPVTCQKDVRRGVRRRDRGQRPTATKDPNTKQRRRRPSRHRWTRGPAPPLAAITRRPNSHFFGLEIVIFAEKCRKFLQFKIL